MDEFFEPYWNLEQARAWAETRVHNGVRFAAIPKNGRPKRGSEIVAWCVRISTDLARNGRDIGAELWAASGWTPPSHVYQPPADAQILADKVGFPLSLAILNKDAQVHRPKPPHTDELLARWEAAPDAEGALMTELADAYSKNKDGFKSDPRLEQLSAALRRVGIEYFSAPEPHGPPNRYVRGAFPTVEYLERLFRTGFLSAIANRPGEPKAYELSSADWAGLEIGCGGKFGRLSVWRRGKASIGGEGDLENVRVARKAV